MVMVHKSLRRQGLFLLSLLLLHASSSLCSADDVTFEVVGSVQCDDCKEEEKTSNFKTTRRPFSGLGVTIDCKLKNGGMKRIGASDLDEQGDFKVSLPQQLVEKDGRKLKQECYAMIHTAASIPCPAHNGLEASKIIFKSQNNGKHVFVPIQNLRFSSALCVSKSFWPIFKHPPLPPLKHFGHPWLFPPLPPLQKPPQIPNYKPLPPPAPVYKPKPKPKPPVVKPPAPIYKPKPPVVKPPAPIYKPKPPAYKPSKKPCPPVESSPPVYKPPVEKPPVVKPLPPPIPIYKPPVIKKPSIPPIPLYPIPKITKKPCPPLPKYFHHPKFGYFPPLPPGIPLA